MYGKARLFTQCNVISVVQEWLFSIVYIWLLMLGIGELTMTKSEAAIIETYTGVCMLTGDDRKYVYKYASKLIGRPIFTHEFATMAEELEAKSKSDFINLCKNLEG